MKRTNLIPITRIYDIYPKYTYSEDVKKFMDKIVDIDRANVYTKDEVISMLTKIQLEIEEEKISTENLHYDDLENAESYNTGIDTCTDIIQDSIDELKSDDGDKIQPLMLTIGWSGEFGHPTHSLHLAKLHQNLKLESVESDDIDKLKGETEQLENPDRLKEGDDSD